MNTFIYNPNLDGLTIIKEDLDKKFFYQGHPEFLIPDFNKAKCDIWLSYMDFLEADKGEEIYDQDGGEIVSHNVIDPKTGLTQCKYTAYGILFEGTNMVDIDVDIEGHVVSDNGRTYFLATKVIENS